MKVLALDIGGTSIKSGLWENGEIHAVQERDTQAYLGGAHVMERAKEAIRGYSGFDRIGISTAGQVDSERGIILYANSNIPEYTGMLVKELMEKEFQVPVSVENDVNCAAVGEAVYGAGKEFGDFLCITLGTGIGGAIIINKQLYKGASFSAGEFGAIITHPEERVRGDAFSGCYERYASTTALVGKARDYDGSLSDGRKIFERMKEPQIKAIVDSWIDEIVLGLVSLTHIFNPSGIVLGGGILSQEYIVDRLNTVFYPGIMDSFRGVKLKGATLGNKAGLYGAAYAALSQTKEKS